jgi:hypothetical protein
MPLSAFLVLIRRSATIAFGVAAANGDAPGPERRRPDLHAGAGGLQIEGVPI